jgi:chemotaxis protein MotB
MPAAASARAGAAARRRRRPHPGGHEEGGAERWLVTYADMLTLLLVLFIVLFSISVVNKSKFISLKTSLGSVFGDGKEGVLPGGNGVNDNDTTGVGEQLVMPGMPVTAVGGTKQASPVDESNLVKTYQAAGAAREKTHFEAIEKAINAALQRAGMPGAARFTITKRGLVITVVTNALVFPGNSAELLSRGQQILAAIAPSLAHETRSIEVDGHTNQQKVSTAPYPSGWELSSARASAVVRYLASHGVAKSRLSAVGYSDQRPLYPASDPRSVTLNRRVEIVVLAQFPQTDTSASTSTDSSSADTSSAGN